MPPKKDKKVKDKKPKVIRQKQKQKQTQTQIVNVIVGDKRGRGRPRKTTQAPVIPQRIYRMNEPPVPFPLQPTVNVVRESVKPITAESVLNLIRERISVAQEQKQVNEIIGEKRARYFENADPAVATPLYTNSQEHSTPMRDNAPQANAMFMTPQTAQAEIIRQRKERSDKGKPRGSYKSKDTPTETTIRKIPGKQIIIGQPKQP